MFFFEKKNQKTFFPFAPNPTPYIEAQWIKAFLLLFLQKKKILAFFAKAPLNRSAPMPYHRQTTQGQRP